MNLNLIGRLYLIVLITSSIIFFMHKIEHRFIDKQGKSCEIMSDNKWQCDFPGLILSHKPWNYTTGIIVSIIYILLIIFFIININKLKNNIIYDKHITLSLILFILFSVLWLYWGYFEIHHYYKSHARINKKQLKRGTVFSTIFVKFLYMIYLPITLLFISCKFYNV